MNRLYLMFLFLIIFLMSIFPGKIMAIGSFELIDFPDSYSATIGKEFNANISFFYSGTEYKPKVSIVGKNFPDGLVLGQVSSSGNSLYNVQYQGTPKLLGNYPLILSLTDDYGAILNKKFNFNVSGLTFSDDPLPNAKVNQPYVQNIDFSFNRVLDNTPVVISFSDIPNDLSFNGLNINTYDKHFTIKLTPKNTGRFSFKARAEFENFEVGSKVFDLKVVDADQPISMNINPINTLKMTTKEEKDIIKNTKKENIKNIPRDDHIQDIGIKNQDQIVKKEVNSVSVDLKPVEKIKWYKRIFLWLFD